MRPGLATIALGQVATARGLVGERAMSVCSGDRRWQWVGWRGSDVVKAARL